MGPCRSLIPALILFLMSCHIILAEPNPKPQYGPPNNNGYVPHGDIFLPEKMAKVYNQFLRVRTMSKFKDDFGLHQSSFVNEKVIQKMLPQEIHRIPKKKKLIENFVQKTKKIMNMARFINYIDKNATMPPSLEIELTKDQNNSLKIEEKVTSQVINLASGSNNVQVEEGHSVNQNIPPTIQLPIASDSQEGLKSLNTVSNAYGRENMNKGPLPPAISPHEFVAVASRNLTSSQLINVASGSNNVQVEEEYQSNQNTPPPIQVPKASINQEMSKSLNGINNTYGRETLNKEPLPPAISPHEVVAAKNPVFSETSQVQVVPAKSSEENLPSSDPYEALVVPPDEPSVPLVPLPFSRPKVPEAPLPSVQTKQIEQTSSVSSLTETQHASSDNSKSTLTSSYDQQLQEASKSPELSNFEHQTPSQPVAPSQPVTPFSSQIKPITAPAQQPYGESNVKVSTSNNQVSQVQNSFHEVQSSRLNVYSQNFEKTSTNSVLGQLKPSSRFMALSEAKKNEKVEISKKNEVNQSQSQSLSVQSLAQTQSIAQPTTQLPSIKEDTYAQEVISPVSEPSPPQTPEYVVSNVGREQPAPLPPISPPEVVDSPPPNPPEPPRPEGKADLGYETKPIPPISPPVFVSSSSTLAPPTTKIIQVQPSPKLTEDHAPEGLNLAEAYENSFFSTNIAQSSNVATKIEKFESSRKTEVSAQNRGSSQTQTVVTPVNVVHSNMGRKPPAPLHPSSSPVVRVNLTPPPSPPALPRSENKVVSTSAPRPLPPSVTPQNVQTIAPPAVTISSTVASPITKIVQVQPTPVLTENIAPARSNLVETYENTVFGAKDSLTLVQTSKKVEISTKTDVPTSNLAHPTTSLPSVIEDPYAKEVMPPDSPMLGPSPPQPVVTPAYNVDNNMGRAPPATLPPSLPLAASDKPSHNIPVPLNSESKAPLVSTPKPLPPSINPYHAKTTASPDTTSYTTLASPATKSIQVQPSPMLIENMGPEGLNLAEAYENSVFGNNDNLALAKPFKVFMPVDRTPIVRKEYQRFNTYAAQVQGVLTHRNLSQIMLERVAHGYTLAPNIKERKSKIIAENVAKAVHRARLAAFGGANSNIKGGIWNDITNRTEQFEDRKEVNMENETDTTLEEFDVEQENARSSSSVLLQENIKPIEVLQAKIPSSGLETGFLANNKSAQETSAVTTFETLPTTALPIVLSTRVIQASRPSQMPSMPSQMPSELDILNIQTTTEILQPSELKAPVEVVPDLMPTKEGFEMPNLPPQELVTAKSEAEATSLLPLESKTMVEVVPALMPSKEGLELPNLQLQEPTTLSTLHPHSRANSKFRYVTKPPLPSTNRPLIIQTLEKSHGESSSNSKKFEDYDYHAFSQKTSKIPLLPVNQEKLHPKSVSLKPKTRTEIEETYRQKVIKQLARGRLSLGTSRIEEEKVQDKHRARPSEDSNKVITVESVVQVSTGPEEFKPRQILKNKMGAKRLETEENISFKKSNREERNNETSIKSQISEVLSQNKEETRNLSNNFMVFTAQGISNARTEKLQTNNQLPVAAQRNYNTQMEKLQTNNQSISTQNSSFSEKSIQSTNFTSSINQLQKSANFSSSPLNRNLLKAVKLPKSYKKALVKLYNQGTESQRLRIMEILRKFTVKARRIMHEERMKALGILLANVTLSEGPIKIEKINDERKVVEGSIPFPLNNSNLVQQKVIHRKFTKKLFASKTIHRMRAIEKHTMILQHNRNSSFNSSFTNITEYRPEIIAKRNESGRIVSVPESQHAHSPLILIDSSSNNKSVQIVSAPKPKQAPAPLILIDSSSDGIDSISKLTINQITHSPDEARFYSTKTTTSPKPVIITRIKTKSIYTKKTFHYGESGKRMRSSFRTISLPKAENLPLPRAENLSLPKAENLSLPRAENLPLATESRAQARMETHSIKRIAIIKHNGNRLHHVETAVLPKPIEVPKLEKLGQNQNLVDEQKALIERLMKEAKGIGRKVDEKVIMKGDKTIQSHAERKEKVNERLEHVDFNRHHNPPYLTVTTMPSKSGGCLDGNCKKTTPSSYGPMSRCIPTLQHDCRTSCAPSTPQGIVCQPPNHLHPQCLSSMFCCCPANQHAFCSLVGGVVQPLGLCMRVRSA